MPRVIETTLWHQSLLATVHISPEFEALAKVERKNGSGRNEVGQLPSQFGERV